MFTVGRFVGGINKFNGKYLKFLRAEFENVNERLSQGFDELFFLFKYRK